MPLNPTTIEQDVERIRRQFIAGEVDGDSLYAVVGPKLNLACATKADDAKALHIMNEMELAGQIKDERERSRVLSHLLHDALSFLAQRRPYEVEHVKRQLAAERIWPEDLRAHLEPLLMASARDEAERAEANRIMDSIDEAIYMQPEPQQSRTIVSLLEEAMGFVRRGSPQ